MYLSKLMLSGKQLVHITNKMTPITDPSADILPQDATFSEFDVLTSTCCCVSDKKT